MIGSSGASGFKNIQLVLGANNSSLKGVLASSGREVEAFQKKVEASNKGLITKGNLLKAGIGGGALAAGAGLAYAALKAAEFDRAMRNFNSLAGLSEQGLAKVEARVISLSTVLPQSATTLAEGLYDVQSSGFAGADAMKVLEASALSASAGLTTTEVSARAISAVLNAYGLKAKDAADVSDVLFQTVNAGVITFDSLASGLGDVVGGAAAAKVSIDQVGSAIATMTLAGVGGAESTTSLNQLLAKIVQPSEALAAMYEKLGYESGAAALEQDGLRGVMEKLRKETGGNITTLLELFPEIRAARGALALMANEGKNYTRVAKQIEDKNARAGASQRVFNEQMKAASNQFQLFKNRADAAAITVGMKLLPVLITLMDAATDFGGVVGDVVDQLGQAFGPGLEDLGRIIGDLLEVVGELTQNVWSLVEPFAKLAVGAAAEAFNALMAVVEPLTDFLSENEGVVMLLAVALGIHLAGGAAAAAVKLEVMATMALVNAVGALGALGDTAKVAGARLAAMVPGAVLTAGIAAAVVAWQNYSAAANEVKDANRRVKKSFADFDMEEAAKAVDDLREAKEELDRRYADNQSMTSFGDGLKDVVDIGGNFRLIGLQAEDAGGKFYEASNELNNMRMAAADLNATMSGMTFDQYVDLMASLSGENGTEAQARAIAQMDAVLKRFGPTLQAAGVDLENYQGGWNGDGMNEVAGALGNVSYKTKDTADTQQNLVDKLGQVEQAMGDTEKAADDLQDALDQLMGAAMGVDEAGINWRQGLADLRKELKETGGGIEGNSLEAGKNRLAIQGQIEKLQELLVAQARNGAGSEQLTRSLAKHRQGLIDAGKAAGINGAQMEALLKQYKLTPDLVETLIKQYGGEGVNKLLKDLRESADKADEKDPKIDVSAPGAKEAKDQIDAAAAAARAADGLRTKITTVLETIGKHAFADGGITSFADGGTLPGAATIQPGSGRGLVQWAEGETGGEAFIPMGRSKRARSTAILAQVADQFGYALVEEVQSYADGKFPPFKFNFRPFRFRDRQKGEKGESYERDKRQAYQEWVKERRDARYRRHEEWEDNRHLWQIGQGQREGAFHAMSGDAGGTLRNLEQAKEAQAQARAELAARRSKNPYDTAEDFYKKPTVTIKDYVKALHASVEATRDWGRDVTKVSGAIGPDVVASLKSMGEDGEKWIKKLANASVKDMKAMAAEIRKIQYATFSQDLHQDIKAQQQFQANLQMLISMGRGDLAAQLADMGYQAGGSIAATAVGMSAKELDRLAHDLKLQDDLSDPLVMDAIALAGMLQSSSKALGIIGLSRASGKPVGDVVGLLERFNGKVFSKLPAKAMSQIRADQQLINEGKQPSGLEYGGIVNGSATGKGMYYRWAEPGSGGESLIPHGLDRRQRALSLWEATGRIIGARVTSGGGTMCVVSPGAVQVQIDASGQAITPAQMERIAKRASNEAMAGLASKLQSGKR